MPIASNLFQIKPLQIADLSAKNVMNKSFKITLQTMLQKVTKFGLIFMNWITGWSKWEFANNNQTSKDHFIASKTYKHLKALSKWCLKVNKNYLNPLGIKCVDQFRHYHNIINTHQLKYNASLFRFIYGGIFLKQDTWGGGYINSTVFNWVFRRMTAYEISTLNS